MVFLAAAQKTGGLMAVALLAGLGIVTFLTEDLTMPTGFVVHPVDIAESSWLVFVLGLFIGAIMVGTYVYLAHVEHDRDE